MLDYVTADRTVYGKKMVNALKKMLSERDWILADGATGTNRDGPEAAGAGGAGSPLARYNANGDTTAFVSPFVRIETDRGNPDNVWQTEVR